MSLDAVDSTTWSGGGAAVGTVSTGDASFESRTGRGSGAALSKTSDESEPRPLIPSESNCSLDKPSRDQSGKTEAPSKEIDERAWTSEDNGTGKWSGLAASEAC